MKKRNFLIQISITAIIIQSLLSGCHNYYKAVQSKTDNNAVKAKVTDSLKNQRFFILRNGSDAFYMKNINVSEDNKSLSCVLELLPAEHVLHLKNGVKGKMMYRKSKQHEFPVLNEVHFYTQYDKDAAVGSYTLPLNKVEKIEVIEKDKVRTTNSYVIGAVGYTVGALAVVTIIALATKSSCPFVSAYSGSGFSLQGEIYGGAILPQLVRDDYMPLKMDPLTDGSLQIKISNELKERQFTDMAELWVITHDKNSRIMNDAQGTIYTITAPEPPLSASLNNSKDVTEALQKPGDQALLYMDDTTAVLNTVELKFRKPAAAKKGKLVLQLKNSYFLDLLYGELAKGFGSYYETYMEQQRKKPVAELQKWTKDQQIPLEISIETKTGWKKIMDINTIGPLATRNLVIPIDLSETTGSCIKIKLSSGFLFWEIDYTALDFSGEKEFQIEKLNPVKAIDETGKNILAKLEKTDGVYLAQPDIGNSATIRYQPSNQMNINKTRSYILHTKGYYEHIRDFKNPPDKTFLIKFKDPGNFPLYGIQLYKKMMNENLKSMAKTN